jgi:hypothetical protein
MLSDVADWLIREGSFWTVGIPGVDWLLALVVEEVVVDAPLMVKYLSLCHGRARGMHTLYGR